MTAFGVNLIVMYFAWFSYTYTIVSAMLILPGLTTLIFWGLVLALNVALGLVDLAISYIPPINHFTARNPLAYVVRIGVCYVLRTMLTVTLDLFFGNYLFDVLFILVGGPYCHCLHASGREECYTGRPVNVCGVMWCKPR